MMYLVLNELKNKFSLIIKIEECSYEAWMLQI